MELKKPVEEALRARSRELVASKGKGVKIIGYYPDEYLPEELVIAAGAIPLGLARGGEYFAVSRAGAYASRWMDTFCRAQIGYLVGQEEIYYTLTDLYISPMIDCNMRIVGDCINFFTKLEEFRFGVPREKSPEALEYYLGGLNFLKDKLESFTGNKITPEKLKESIDMCNEERELLKQISTTRKAALPPISGKEFIGLLHASYVLDKKKMLELLHSFEGLKDRKGLPKGPRIMLTGTTLAWGDDKVIDLIEKTGSNIVIEQYCEALRDYWDNVEVGKTLEENMQNIAKRYLLKKPAHVAMVPSKDRQDLIMKLIKDFKVDGVLWYQPMYRDEGDMESFYFEKRLKKEAGIPFMKLDTEYDPYEIGPMSTRVETFIELARK